MADDEGKSGSSEGPAIDRTGAPVVDPSRNVLDLVDAAIRRQDDMAELRTGMSVAEAEHLREIMRLRADHNAMMIERETTRIDAIRATDADAVKTATKALNVLLDSMRGDIADLRRAQYQAQGERTQSSDARATSTAVIGWIFGALGATIAIVSLVFALITR